MAARVFVFLQLWMTTSRKNLDEYLETRINFFYDAIEAAILEISLNWYGSACMRRKPAILMWLHLRFHG